MSVRGVKHERLFFTRDVIRRAKKNVQGGILHNFKIVEIVKYRITVQELTRCQANILLD